MRKSDLALHQNFFKPTSALRLTNDVAYPNKILLNNSRCSFCNEQIVMKKFSYASITHVIFCAEQYSFNFVTDFQITMEPHQCYFKKFRRMLRAGILESAVFKLKNLTKKARKICNKWLAYQ